MNPEVIGYLLKIVKSTTSTKIKMEISITFFPLGISSVIYSQMEY